MRSDERFYFFLAAFCMTGSLVYTVFFHVLPELDARHDYIYAHCTVTGDGHWEKYETINGIKERVVVPVEVRIGTIEGALDWDSSDVLDSKDAYHQGIGRDKPSGWEYFTKQEKQDYLKTYTVGREYECWMQPGSGTNEVVFHKKPVSFRLIPELVFCAIVLFLCIATGVCVGMADSLRGILRLPPSDAAHGDDHEEEEEDTLHGVASDRHYGSLEQRLGPKGASVVYRQFAPAGSGDKDGDREWV